MTTERVVLPARLSYLCFALGVSSTHNFDSFLTRFRWSGSVLSRCRRLRTTRCLRPHRANGGLCKRGCGAGTPTARPRAPEGHPVPISSPRDNRVFLIETCSAAAFFLFQISSASASKIRACVAGVSFRKCEGFFFFLPFFARFQLFGFGKEIIVEKVFLEMMTEAKLYSFVENRDI